MNTIKFQIPKYIATIIKNLEKADFEAFVVGGCVRDLLMENPPAGGPKDWDIATNAKPEEIIKIFPDSVYENEFGTVGVKIADANLQTKYKSANNKKNKVVEITTYRVESKYTDKRHPDKIKFAKTLEEDLSRRDFTINAMAIELMKAERGVANKSEYKIIDLFGGQEDLKKKIIRSVGEANERFNEDALRMMRAVRFAIILNGWEIEKNTFEAIKKNAKNLNYISKERIRDELEKIILSARPADDIGLLHETGLLKYIVPELEAGFDVTQSHHHYYGPYNTVYKHSLASLEKCPSGKLEVRLAALLHDIGKPEVKKGEGEKATFYSHEYAGARIAKKILERLKFSRAIIEKTVLLIKNHMFYYNVDEVGETGVRRVIQKVGLENISDLIDVRIADRLGSGVPKAVPYKLRHFKFMVEKVSCDAISVKQLRINGNDLIKELKIKPGPKIGTILDVLLAQVIDNPKLNNKKSLLNLAGDLNKKDLNSLRLIAKKKIEDEKKEEESLMKKKYWVE